MSQSGINEMIMNVINEFSNHCKVDKIQLIWNNNLRSGRFLKNKISIKPISTDEENKR